MTRLLTFLQKLSRGLIRAQVLTYRFQPSTLVFSSLVRRRNTTLGGRQNVPTLGLVVRRVQINDPPLNVVIILQQLFRLLIGAHIWEIEKISLVVALRICLLDWVYLFAVQNVSLNLGRLFLGCSDYAHWVIQIIFVSSSILHPIIPLWGCVSFSVVNYEFKALTSLDQDISFETFEILVISAWDFDLPARRIRKLTEDLHMRAWTQILRLKISVIQLEVKGGHKLVLVLE